MDEKKKKLLTGDTPSATQTNASGTQSASTGASGTYVPSDAVKAAQAAIAAQKKPTPYTSKWQAQIDNTVNQILGGKEFKYDVNSDKLFDTYKTQAQRSGKLAMDDTVAKMSTMTGGYGNSFAQTAGQAAYAKEMQKVTDIIPELEALAYERYRDKRNDLKDNLNILRDAEETEYGRHRNDLADYLTERDYLTGRADTERSFDYAAQADADDRDYRERSLGLDTMWKNIDRQDTLDRYKVQDERYDTEWEHQLDRERIADQQAANDAALGWYKASLSSSKDNESTPAEDEYLPFGNVGEKDFYKDMAGYYSDYMDAGGKDAAGLNKAVALVKRVGATDEAKQALADYFGEEALRTAFPTATDKFKNGLVNRTDFIRNGRKVEGVTYSSYDDYIIAAAEAWYDNGDLTEDEFVDIIMSYGLEDLYGN